VGRASSSARTRDEAARVGYGAPFSRLCCRSTLLSPRSAYATTQLLRGAARLRAEDARTMLGRMGSHTGQVASSCMLPIRCVPSG
jgi:hypothetical protein